MQMFLRNIYRVTICLKWCQKKGLDFSLGTLNFHWLASLFHACSSDWPKFLQPAYKIDIFPPFQSFQQLPNLNSITLRHEQNILLKYWNKCHFMRSTNLEDHHVNNNFCFAGQKLNVCYFMLKAGSAEILCNSSVHFIKSLFQNIYKLGVFLNIIPTLFCSI
jgi:hypothetical protein